MRPGTDSCPKIKKEKNKATAMMPLQQLATRGPAYSYTKDYTNGATTSNLGQHTKDHKAPSDGVYKYTVSTVRLPSAVTRTSNSHCLTTRGWQLSTQMLRLLLHSRLLLCCCANVNLAQVCKFLDGLKLLSCSLCRDTTARCLAALRNQWRSSRFRLAASGGFGQ